MQRKILNAVLLLGYLLPFKLFALPEMIIGEATIEPGIHLIFECGIKDDIAPNNVFLSESETDVHIEVLANWSENAPKGTTPGGHVAYLIVSLVVKNEITNISDTVNLVPHLNLSDNLHYAQNIKLPGKIDDKYTLKCITIGVNKWGKRYLRLGALHLTVLIFPKLPWLRDARIFS